METPRRDTGPNLRLLDAALTLAVLFFAVGSVTALATTPATLGSGGLGVDAGVTQQVDEGVQQQLASEFPNKIERADVTLKLHVGKTDRDTRTVIAAGLLLGIALGWIGLLSLRGVVRSARDGDAFDRRNVTRLRRLGAVIIAMPLVIQVLNRLLESTFDSDLVRPRIGQAGTAPLVVVGIAVLALAEVFREGAAMRELEASTI